jgi:hypothetical protein
MPNALLARRLLYLRVEGIRETVLRCMGER